jgi:hypothetical protein
MKFTKPDPVDTDFHVRLDPQLAKKLRHFMGSRDYTDSQALSIIISKFFA